MKPSKFSFPSSGYRSPWLSYWMVAGLAVLIILCLFSEGITEINPDARSFYFAGELIFNGVVDDFRTPVYPIILHLLKYVFDYEGSKIAVTILQVIAFVISVIYVNKSIRLITPQYHRLNFWITIVYLILGLDTRIAHIMSDSLATSCSAFLIYCLIRTAQSNTLSRYAIWTSVWLLLLVFNRPVTICFVPVISLFWIALYLKYRQTVLKNVLIGISGVVIIMALLGAYCREVNKQYNIHSISFVSVVNNYMILRYGGLITPNDTDNPEFKKYLEERFSIKSGDLTITQQREEMGHLFDFPYSMHPIVEKAVNHAIKSNLKATIRAIIKWSAYNNGRIIYINALMLFAGVVLLVYSCLYRVIPLTPWALFLLGCSLLFAIFVGANGDYGRLSAPMYPMFVLIVGWAFSKVRLVP